MLIAEERISFLQIVTSDFDSALWFSLQRNSGPDLLMYTKKHELYSGIWFGELRAEFEPGVSLVDYVCMYVCIYMCVCVCVQGVS